MAKKKQETPIEAIEGALEDEAKELKREYKRFEKFRDENSLLLGVFTLGLAALVIINTLFWVQWSNHRAAQVNKQNTTVASLKTTTTLQSARNFAVTARVTNVGTSKDVNPIAPLAETETLLSMDITVTNNTQKTQHLIPVSQFYVRGEDGTYASLKPTMAASPLASQDLAPGQSASGSLSYAISERQTRPLLYIDTHWDDSTPLVIDVLH